MSPKAVSRIGIFLEIRDGEDLHHFRISDICRVSRIKQGWGEDLRWTLVVQLRGNFDEDTWSFSDPEGQYWNDYTECMDFSEPVYEFHPVK